MGTLSLSFVGIRLLSFLMGLSGGVINRKATRPTLKKDLEDSSFLLKCFQTSGPCSAHLPTSVADAPPVLLYSFIEQTLQPGPAVSLKCSAAGNPTPQISWTLDGFPLPSNGRSVLKTQVCFFFGVLSSYLGASAIVR